MYILISIHKPICGGEDKENLEDAFNDSFTLNLSQSFFKSAAGEEVFVSQEAFDKVRLSQTIQSQKSSIVQPKFSQKSQVKSSKQQNSKIKTAKTTKKASSESKSSTKFILSEFKPE